jgi:hypothetical protein
MTKPVMTGYSTGCSPLNAQEPLPIERLPKRLGKSE